jgi:hypothetical protein
MGPEAGLASLQQIQQLPRPPTRMGLAQPDQLLCDRRIGLPGTGAGPPRQLVEALLSEVFEPVDPLIGGFARDIESFG